MRKGVRIVNLTKLYSGRSRLDREVKAVDNISVEILPGEFITLLGPSGCGKTTTLRMIAGFERPTSGEIYLGDEMINNISPDKRDTAMVFQSYALFPNYNVWGNIAYGLKLKGLSKADISKKVETIINLVGLNGLESRQTNQLSGGQQQRVALARALVMEPGVLLFDEPLSNLDAQLRVQMRTEIRKIQKELGITAIYVTHDQAEAMSMSDRIVILKDGVIAQTGTPKDVYYHPNSSFVASFLGTTNFLKGTIRAIDGNYVSIDVLGKTVDKVEYHGAGKVGDPCTIVLRPEAGHISAEGLLPITVTYSMFMGSYQYYEAKLGDEIIMINESNPKNKYAYSAGESAYLSLDVADVHCLAE